MRIEGTLLADAPTEIVKSNVRLTIQTLRRAAPRNSFKKLWTNLDA